MGLRRETPAWAGRADGSQGMTAPVCNSTCDSRASAGRSLSLFRLLHYLFCSQLCQQVAPSLAALPLLLLKFTFGCLSGLSRQPREKAGFSV